LTVALTKANRPITEAELAAVERSLDVRLPDSYRRFLLEHDGGEPEDNFFDPAEGAQVEAGETGVDAFLSGAEIIEKRTGLYRDRIPLYMLPVARAAGGDMICLSLRDEDFGAVYLWFHEEEADPDEGEEPGDRNLYSMADDFDAMLERLKPIDELEIDTDVEAAEVWVDPEFYEEQRRLGNVTEEPR
jgi:hypothetical protein